LINGTTTGIIATDPISGIPTLRYLLGVPVTPGDVALSENPTSGLPSDLVRFVPNSANPSQTYLFFFSDKEAGDVPPFDLADVDQLPTPQAGFVNLLEVGPEGQNGALYTPTANQPGSYPGLQVTYNILSDVVVPEPSGLALLSIGGGLLLLFRRRQHATN
jgi:hypothetical protein